MFDEIWNRIIKTNYEKIPAHLAGYRRVKIKDEVFPGIICGEGIVDGIVRLNVASDDIHILDGFETECYERIEVTVKDGRKKEIIADTYKIRDSYKEMLEETEWNAELFKLDSLAMFSSGYTGFNKIE